MNKLLMNFFQMWNCGCSSRWRWGWLQLSPGLQVSDGWTCRRLTWVVTFSSPSPSPFFFLFFMLCVHTCPSAHAFACASICRSQKRTPGISLYHFFPLLPWENLPLNLEFTVFQLGWLTSKCQQSSSLCRPPSVGVKCSFCHDHPFNVSPEGLMWPCWNPYLFPVPYT